jgi:DnaJ domain
MDLRDAYLVLEVPSGASKEVAREARNLLAKVWHPDRHQGDQKVRVRAEEKLKQINEAYGLLERVGFPKQHEPSPATESTNVRATGQSHDAHRGAPRQAAPKPNADSQDWNDRKLCPDGACIGLVGTTGRCKVCGTPAQ